MATAAMAAVIQPRAESSTAEPIPVPYDLHKFSLAAGLVQQTYCPSTQDKKGLKVGDATLLWTYGDGGDTQQRVNLYHSDSLGIAVAIQGTNISSLKSIVDDALLFSEKPDWRYRKYVPDDVVVMNGFQEGYQDVVDDVFVNVHKYMQLKNEERVTIIGHSLGAAIGLILAVDFDNRLDKGITGSYLFGLPRVGNPAFANYVDARLGKKLHWAVNGRDWVPTVPPRVLGYQHPSNYIWINPGNSTHWKLYPGQENVHGFTNVLDTQFPSFDDHQGVYFHTQIGTIPRFGSHCPALVGQD
ncbi:lipid metabolic protein [Malassezia pachydermatis]|uniref:Putative secretory lipase (Family 3) n=1 Tax=Malassezia pachydermatis TaxID=77020 RepID=A0A0M8MYR0_9BASI|nr:putative secretory lipase (family 3) [Malassezia pachydermatis]KOS16241.1 putative secretory lipase (family 3) [Malassezia pachydermatis]